MEKKRVVSVNTDYPSVMKIPGEVSPKLLARRNSLKTMFDSNLTKLEYTHKRDMVNFEKRRKHLERNMHDYKKKKSKVFNDKDQQRTGLSKGPPFFVTKRPVSLDERSAAADQAGMKAEKLNSSRDTLSPRLLNTSDPAIRSVSETLYREKTTDNGTRLPNVHMKPSASPPEYLLTNAFERKPELHSNHTRDAYSRKSVSQTRVSTDSAYSSGLDERDSRHFTGSGDSPDMDDDDILDKIVDISSFPYFEVNEISKHKKMNEQAEKLSKKRPSPMLNRFYLQRLRYARQQYMLPPRKEGGPTVKKKPPPVNTKKAPPKEPAWSETPIETPPPQPIRREDFDKPGKIIQSFRYSYAIEDYFRRRSRRYSDASSMTDFDIEIKNGWMIKSLGARVLNEQSRALPSVSPQQWRMRVRLQKAHALDGSRTDRSPLQRMSSRESATQSRTSVREPLVTKSRVMDEIPEEETSKEKVKKRGVHFSDSVETLKSASNPSVESQTSLPDIQVTSAPEQPMDSSQRRTTATDESTYLGLPVIVEG